MSYYYIDPKGTNEYIVPTIRDTREVLRAMIHGYIHECRSLKSAIRNSYGPLRGELFISYTNDTQPCARAAMIAMRIIKGSTEPVDCIEGNTYNMPDVGLIRHFVETYGSEEVRESCNWDDIESKWQQLVDDNIHYHAVYYEDEILHPTPQSATG